MPDPSQILALDDLPWRPSPHEGVEWKKLRFDPASGCSTVLLRFAPGASYGAHLHPEGEEYLVLEGSLVDGGQEYGPGTYVHHPPGSVHRPRSPQGCVVYVHLAAPIEEVNDSRGEDRNSGASGGRTDPGDR